MKTFTILIVHFILIAFWFSNPSAETVFGRSLVGTSSSWDIGTGTHDTDGDFRILPYDTYDLYPANGAEFYTLSGVGFHDVKTASADTTDYVAAGYGHTNMNYVHVFRTVEGNYAKIRIDLFNNFGGEDYNIEWVYQTDGSTNLDHLLGVEESSWGAIKELFETE